MLDSTDYELLVKMTVLFLIKNNISRFRSNLIFIKLFKLKNFINSEEEFFLSILYKSIDLLDNEFGLFSKKTDDTNTIVKLNKEDVLEYILEFNKKEFLDKKFYQTKFSVLNPNGK
jgi:hypothetical protein